MDIPSKIHNNPVVMIEEYFNHLRQNIDFEIKAFIVHSKWIANKNKESAWIEFSRGIRRDGRYNQWIEYIKTVKAEIRSNYQENPIVEGLLIFHIWREISTIFNTNWETSVKPFWLR